MRMPNFILGLVEPAPWHSPIIMRWMGLFCVLMYATLRILLPEVGEAFGTLMALLGLAAVLTWGKRLRSSGPLWLLLCVIFVQLVSWVSGYLHHPEWMTSNPQIDRLAKWFLFIAIAWWLGGSTKLTLLAWGLGTVGFIISVCLPAGSFATWQSGLQGSRVDFGIRNAQHTAMYFGTILIGLLCFSRRCLKAGRIAWLRRLSWLFVAGICLVGIGVTQTRAIWLGLLVVLPLLAVMASFYYHSISSKRRWGKLTWLCIVMMIIVAGSVGGAFKEHIDQRLERERSVVIQAMEEDWKTLPFSSIGNRLLSWRAASEWIRERPLVGWGEQGRSLVIEETEWLPQRTRRNFGHLHNTYLELAVSYGALGLLAIVVLIYWVGLGAWKAWRAGKLPDDMAMFSLFFFIFYAIINQFESYGFFWTGSYLQNLIMGGIVTHIWRWQWETGCRVFWAMKK